MAINVRNASYAGASDSIDELRETIASLEAQVTSLYEEREAAGGATAGGDSDGLLALYEQKAAVSRSTVADLQASVQSFEQQLQSFYEGRETGNDTESTIVGLNEQLKALYDERQEHGDLPAVVEGLEAQLAALYSEREDGEYAQHSGGDVAALIVTVRSFEEQLATLYEAQAAATYGLTEANEMVQSLEPQVAALLEERNDLAEQLHVKLAELERSRSKAKDMVAALMESALA